MREIGGEPPRIGSFTLRAVDSRGVNATVSILVRVSGFYIVFNITDIDIPIPDDPWRENILTRIRSSIEKSKAEAFEKPSMCNVDVYLLDTSTGERTDFISTSDSTLIIDSSLAGLKPGRTFRVELFIEYWYIKVSDAGIDVTITSNAYNSTSGLIKTYYRLYIPYLMINRYNKLSESLHGFNNKYRTFLADQALMAKPLTEFLEITRSVLVKRSGEASSEGGMLPALIDSLKKSTDKAFYPSPKIWLPEIGDFPGYVSELSIISTRSLNYRDEMLRLTPEILLFNSDNYWTKLAKPIIIMAEIPIS